MNKILSLSKYSGIIWTHVLLNNFWSITGFIVIKYQIHMLHISDTNILSTEFLFQGNFVYIVLKIVVAVK